MATRKAAVVSLSSLNRSVEAALRIAAKRNKLGVQPGNLIDRWEIIGRRLAKAVDLGLAFTFAADVAAAVKVPGLSVDPAVARIGPDIWVGFIDKGRTIKGLS